MSEVEILFAALVAAHNSYRDRVGEPRSLLGSPDPEKADFEIIAIALRKMAAFNEINAWAIWAKGRQQLVTDNWLAEWAFPRWHFGDDHELMGNAERIYKLITSRNHSTSMFTAVWGATSDATIEINEDLSVQPFSALKSRDAKDWADGSVSTPNRFLGAYRSAASGSPGVAIVITDDEFPFLSPDWAGQIRRSQEMITASQRACLSLEVFGTGRPIIDISWFECRDDDLDAIWYDKIRFWRQPEVIPLSIEPVKIDGQSLAEMHSRLMALPDGRQQRVVKSMRRFELSLARRDLGDQAIDLCTAFEQILSGGNGPISLKNALRCAGLLAGSAKERLHHRDIFEALYVVRNNVVHGGHAGGLVKTHTIGKIPVEQVIREARSMYCRAVGALVRYQTEPSWFELETCSEVTVDEKKPERAPSISLA